MFEIVNRYIKTATAEAISRGAYLRGADLQGAYLQSANLEGAYLEGAYLGGAYLGGAKGLLSKPITPLQILGTRHAIIVRQDGHVTIGCIHKPLVWWEAEYTRIGRVEGYDVDAIAEYGMHIAHCRSWMTRYDVLEVKQPDASETV